MSQIIGIIGLGNMGCNMGATLVKKGFTVIGFDLSEQARQKATAQGMQSVSGLQDLANKSSVVILSLPKAEHVEAVCLGEQGLAQLLAPDSVVIDTTTSVPETSRLVAEAFALRNIGFLDAPVSGGPAGAAAGTMSMVIGGNETLYQSVLPVLEAMSSVRVHVGDVGAGNIAKIANNMLAAAHLITTAEALTLAEKAGVDPEKVLQAINAGSGRSGASQAMFPNWVMNKAYNSGFTMGLMRKDIGLAASLAADLQLDLPMTKQTATLWQNSHEQIADTQDFCCITQYTNPDLFS
ncbi:NAD(P)-dependent oxidoreductase [Marinomonas posidonica]|uniref:3-hydroxyisobutyrate dehydrogenase n=1 Tax=Marinomonas posidonica (strain CECT 7376 / NCIMB 14433 / IVIA-Po-181) TaxID=491952 RepID=F6CV51_MARPP|nr:NAD(P)-dependent oxidoreductase [Marinomonas posidonica]AEF56471.1 3-hydroxyisobutyrate dehydrogenase [Marinomonas posidonica IVIA-Po-181]